MKNKAPSMILVSDLHRFPVDPTRTVIMQEPVRPLLTKEEIENLPDGTEIVVTWSGGNGPHRYIFGHSKWGAPVARANGIEHGLDFVGHERCHTRVRRA